MDYHLENRVQLSTEREHKNLYSWSIKEFDQRGKQIGGDRIPWEWSLRFEIIELIPTFKIEINNESDDQVETNKAELSEYLSGKLRPISESRRSGLYAMFGSQREITEFGLFIYKSGDGKNRCRLWGNISYTSELDFEDVTEQDSVQMYIYLSAEKFDQLMNFVKFPRPTGAEIRLNGVSGFYSEWSPSIRTDSIKILANATDQNLENPEGLDFTPPVLGYVKEFELILQQHYPLAAKRT